MKLCQLSDSPPRKSPGITVADANVLTVNELSVYLHVHRSTIYRLLKKGRLPAFKIGSDWRFSIEAIDQWRLGLDAARMEEIRKKLGS